MHMMLMAGIILFLYFFSLALICLYRDKINTKIFNLVFVITDVIFFFCWNYAAYQKGWLEKRFMTLDNISPFTFTVIPFIYIMKDSVKDYCLSSVAFLSFGMFCAMLISPERAYLFDFDQEASFLYASEAFCHMHCSLFGIYLMVTRQVKVDFRHWIKSIVFTYSYITFGVLLNIVFHKNFFGMNPYGNYSIYFLDIFGGFEITLIAYYLGVLVVLTLGWQVGWLLERLLSGQKYSEIKPLQLIEPVEGEDFVLKTAAVAALDLELAVSKEKEEENVK